MFPGSLLFTSFTPSLHYCSRCLYFGYVRFYYFIIYLIYLFLLGTMAEKRRPSS